MSWGSSGGWGWFLCQRPVPTDRFWRIPGAESNGQTSRRRECRYGRDTSTHHSRTSQGRLVRSFPRCGWRNFAPERHLSRSCETNTTKRLQIWRMPCSLPPPGFGCKMCKNPCQRRQQGSGFTVPSHEHCQNLDRLPNTPAACLRSAVGGMVGVVPSVTGARTTSSLFRSDLGVVDGGNPRRREGRRRRRAQA